VIVAFRRYFAFVGTRARICAAFRSARAIARASIGAAAFIRQAAFAARFKKCCFLCRKSAFALF